MLCKIACIVGIIFILPIAIFVSLILAGLFQYIINYRIGTYFGLPFYSSQKSHRLTKLVIPSFLLLIKYPPEVAKAKLQKDFIEKAIPEGVALLKPRYSMYLVTHLISEETMQYLPQGSIREQYATDSFTIYFTQLTAWLVWIIRGIRIRNFSYKPPQIIGRTWYKITWTN